MQPSSSFMSSLHVHIRGCNYYTGCFSLLGTGAYTNFLFWQWVRSCVRTRLDGMTGAVICLTLWVLWLRDTPVSPWLHAALSEVCPRLRVTQPRLHGHSIGQH